MALRTLFGGRASRAVVDDGGGTGRRAVVAAAAKAMGTETLNSITYSVPRATGRSARARALANRWPGEPDANHADTPGPLTSRKVSPPRWCPAQRARRSRRPPGVPAPMPGVFNQNITNQQLGAGWNQALNWTTPWGFVKGAAAAVADASFSHKSQGGQSVLSYSPPALKSPSGQPYRVTGYINSQNLVTKVETHVENAVVGDLLHEFDIELSEHERRSGSDPHRAATGRHGDVRSEHHRGDAEPIQPDGAAHGSASAGPRRRPADRRGRLLLLRAVAQAAPHSPLRLRSKNSATAPSRSAGITPRSRWTWAITSWLSRAAAATRAAWR